jgi:hypothetical protein
VRGRIVARRRPVFGDAGPVFGRLERPLRINNTRAGSSSKRHRLFSVSSGRVAQSERFAGRARPRSICLETVRSLSASARRAVLIRSSSSSFRAPLPSSKVQILNLLTPDIRASLLWEIPSALLSARRFISYSCSRSCDE